MRYDPSEWLGMVVMRVEGSTNPRMSAVLQEVAAGHRLVFQT